MKLSRNLPLNIREKNKLGFIKSKGSSYASLSYFVEMPGVEPGSEDKTIKTPTFIACFLISLFNTPAGRIV